MNRQGVFWYQSMIRRSSPQWLSPDITLLLPMAYVGYMTQRLGHFIVVW